MRAHLNCVENLPVYGAIVLVMVVSGAQSAMLDVLALTLIGARIWMHEAQATAVLARSAKI